MVSVFKNALVRHSSEGAAAEGMSIMARRFNDVLVRRSFEEAKLEGMSIMNKKCL